MKTFLKQTLGGLTLRYYLRNLLIISVIPIFFMLVTTLEIKHFLLFIVMTLLYPYAKFAFDEVLGFILGNNEFILSIKSFFIINILIISFIWSFSIFIAPIGLLFLYVMNRKQEE